MTPAATLVRAVVAWLAAVAHAALNTVQEDTADCPAAGSPDLGVFLVADNPVIVDVPTAPEPEAAAEAAFPAKQS